MTTKVLYIFWRSLVFLLCCGIAPLFAQNINFIQQFSPESAPVNYSPIALTINSNGDFYALDASSHSIQVFDAIGKWKKSLSSVKTPTGFITLKDPQCIAADLGGNVYVYDKGLGKILVINQNAEGFAFGDKGGQLGQSEQIKSIAVDNQSNIYLLNSARKQIDIYNSNGEFLSWFAGGFEAFGNPLAIGISGLNELYVLDGAGPNIVMFDLNGNQTNFHRNFSNWDGASMKSPIAMQVMANGDFFVLDEVSCKIIHFNRLGKVLGSTGAKGNAAPGSFLNAISLASHPGAKSEFVVLDAGTKSIQKFGVETETPFGTTYKKRMRVEVLPFSRMPLQALAISKNGTRFGIPLKNSQKVIAFKDSSSTELFIVNAPFKNVVDLACDNNGNLYVLDAGHKEIFMFDEKGVLKRRFGNDIPVKLKDPCSIAVQKSGNLVLCDKGNGNIHLWDANGIYQKIITSADNSALESPVKIDVDSKDQIYIWDQKENCIYRTASGGWPVALQRLTVKAEKPGTDKGNIADFFIDPLDQIYVHNSLTNQIEIYNWDLEPQVFFTVGHPSSGRYSLSSVQRMVADEELFLIYTADKSGSQSKALQFMVQPPAPSANVSYSVANGKLQIVYSKSDSKMVSAYGLLTTDSRGRDSIAVKGNDGILAIDESAYNDLILRKYKLVSLSNSDYSEPAMDFNNYLGYADRLLSSARFDEALEAYDEALTHFGKAGGIRNHIAAKLSYSSQSLSVNAELGKALMLMRRAFELEPDNKEVRDLSGKVLYAWLNEMANRDDIAGIIDAATDLKEIKGFKLLLLNSIDSLCNQLAKVPNDKTIGNAVVLGKTIMKWEADNAKYANTVAASGLALFRHKTLIGVPALELEAIINDAAKHAGLAVSALKLSKRPYLQQQWVHLQILNAAQYFAEAEKVAISELNENQFKMDAALQTSYRLELARAYSGQNKHAQAAAEYRKMLEADRENAEIKSALAEALIADEKYQEAKEIYFQLMISDINNARYAAQIGIIELKLENFAEASFQLEKAVRQDPSDRSFYGPLAKSFEGVSNYNKALENYKIALQYQEDLIQQSKNKMTSSAERKQLNSDLNFYYFKLASLYDQLGFYDEAVAAWKASVKSDASNARAFYGLGMSSVKAGMVYEAVNAFASASKLEPADQTYSTEYQNAVKLREQVAKNESPVSILDLSVNDVYPSLFHNYSDVALLPVGAVTLANNTDLPISLTAVSVFVKELMDTPSEVQAPVLSAYSNTYFNLSALFSDDILNFTEDKQLQMELKIEYFINGSKQNISKSAPLLLHGRNQITWSDKRRLAAFVAPSVSAFVEYDKKSDLIFRDFPEYGMNASILQAMQIYTVLYKDGYFYSPDPVQSFAYVSTHTETPDYLQYPAETMKRKSGDCDDLVALYAALLENAGVPTAYVDVPGHVFLAFDAQMSASELTGSGLGIKDVIIYQNKVWIPVESTLLGKHGFMAAWKKGAERYYEELAAGNYPEVVPMADARRIYRPSVYIPQSFSIEPNGSRDVLNEYQSQLVDLITKVNQSVLRNLESRYQTESGNLYVMNKYAALLARIGQDEKAAQILKEALELSPSNPVILNNLGNIYLAESNALEAINYYSRAAEADKSDGEILINLCKAYLMAGDKENAKENFAKALVISEELGYLYDELKTQLQ